MQKDESPEVLKAAKVLLRKYGGDVRTATIDDQEKMFKKSLGIEAGEEEEDKHDHHDPH